MRTDGISLCQTCSTMRGTGDTTTETGLQASHRSSRAVAGLPVRIFIGQECILGLMEDFSCSGMFVRTEREVPGVAACQVHLLLPGKGELVLDCKVMRAEAFDDHSAGLGLCFAELQ